MCDVSVTSVIVCILFNMGKPEKINNIRPSDKILIENLRKHNKRWSSRKLLKEFPSKGCSRSGLDKVDSLLKRIDTRENADRAVGSGRPGSAKTSANITKVEELVCSQEDEPQSSY